MNKTTMTTEPAGKVWERLYPDRRKWEQLDESTKEEWRRFYLIALEVNRGGRTMQVEPDPTHDCILDGQPKPTGQQVAWVFAHLADLCRSDGQSYGYIMQRMFGYPSEEKMIAMGPGQFVTNAINCAISNVDVQREIARCYL